MIVQVNGGTRGIQVVQVPDNYGRDEAIKIAFRFVTGRREKDYNELAHATAPIQISQTVTTDAAELALRMR